jgi:hypothetical protein
LKPNESCSCRKNEVVDYLGYPNEKQVVQIKERYQQNNDYTRVILFGLSVVYNFAQHWMISHQVIEKRLLAKYLI